MPRLSAIGPPVILTLMLFIAVVVKCDTIKFFKRINHLSRWGCETAVERDPNATSATDVYALTLLNISKIYRIDATSLTRYHRRLHMPNESPLRGTEKWMTLDVRCASACS